jgi:hypothetical protein
MVDEAIEFLKSCNYALVVVPSKLMGNYTFDQILHWTFYAVRPTENDIEHLREELESDDDINLIDIIHECDVLEAYPEMVRTKKQELLLEG